MLGIVKKVGRRSNISSNACAWKQQKWEHHYVQPPCEKHSHEICLDWGKNTIFDAFTKIKLRCCLHFNGINHICIIGTEAPNSSREKLLKMAKDRIPSAVLVFFPESKTTEQTNLCNGSPCWLHDPHVAFFPLLST